MIPLGLAALADIVGGEVLDDTERNVTGVSIDSRTTMSGDLFVPLVGDHIDGHHFISAAMAAGAAAFFCTAAFVAQASADVPGGILVDDPLDALTGLGAWLRDEVDPVVIAITGSNGKTTTKDLAAAAIGAHRVTVANPGSFNNEIGLPLTLCLLTADTEVLICEIGSRGIGHIAQVMPLLRPDIAVVTTIAGAHIGEFGSMEALVDAKSELVLGLVDDGVAILNADVPLAAGMRAHAPSRVVTFGQSAEADMRPDSVEYDDRATAHMVVRGVPVTLPRPGVHQVTNALAALAAAMEVGVPLDVAATGLATAGVSRWRMDLSVTNAGVTVLNDAYNANPDSTIAAIDTLARIATTGCRWAVLGFMAELGKETGRGHNAVGAHVAQAAIDHLVVVEARAGGIADGARQAGFTGRILSVPDVGEAADTVSRLARPGDIVLVKGSRSAGMEHVADVLANAADISPGDISPGDISPGDISPGDISPSDTTPQEGSP